MKQTIRSLCLFCLTLGYLGLPGTLYAQDNDMDITSLPSVEMANVVDIVQAAHDGEVDAIPGFNLTRAIKVEVKRPIKVIANKTISKPVITLPASGYDELFTKYGSQFNVPADKLKKIANCESHVNPGAVSRSGTYGGMYQYSASTWSSTRKAMSLDPDPQLRFDAEQSIMTTAFKIASGGIGAWPVCGKR